MPEVVPDPSEIGSIAQPPYAILPEPVRLFRRRAERLRHLAQESRLGPYLAFLADLAAVQASLADSLPPVAPLPPARIALARESRMPPLDRLALAGDPALGETLDAVVAAGAAIAMPEAARTALDAVRAADAVTRAWLLGNVLSDVITAQLDPRIRFE